MPSVGIGIAHTEGPTECVPGAVCTVLNDVSNPPSRNLGYIRLIHLLVLVPMLAWTGDFDHDTSYYADYMFVMMDTYDESLMRGPRC